MKMTIQELKNNREVVKEKFTIFLEWIKPNLTNKMQIDAIEDAAKGVDGFFEAEISLAENIHRISGYNDFRNLLK